MLIITRLTLKTDRREKEVAIYHHKKIQGQVQDDVSLQLNPIESIFLEINHPSKFVIGRIYRPPGTSTPDFLQVYSLDIILQTISTLKHKCYIMGDFNVIFDKKKTKKKKKKKTAITLFIICAINYTLINFSIH